MSTACRSISLGLMVLTIMATAVYYAMPHVMTIPEIGALENIPLTEHARNAHANEAWTVQRIIQLINRRMCHPVQVYVCAQRQEVRFICPIEPGSDVWAGLLIGYRTLNFQPVVISAHLGPYSYWMRSMLEDGCSLAAQLP